LRVAAMLTARRLLSHEVRSDHLSVKSSPFGELCLQYLKGSSRELRITAGYEL
jgi:serine/threonine-protein kinase ATR